MVEVEHEPQPNNGSGAVPQKNWETVEYYNPSSLAYLDNGGERGGALTVSTLRSAIFFAKRGHHARCV